jgi:hypothetical protein
MHTLIVPIPLVVTSATATTDTAVTGLPVWKSTNVARDPINVTLTENVPILMVATVAVV